LFLHDTKRSRDTSRYVVIQRRKGKKYQAVTGRDAFAHSHLYRNLKKRGREREREKKYITNETDIADT